VPRPSPGIGQGIHEPEIGHGGHSADEALQAPSRARVHREDDGTLRLDPRENAEMEVHVRVGQLEVGEEGIRDGPVVVLARVDQQGARLRPRAQLGDDGRDLYCVSPGFRTPQNGAPRGA